MSDPLKKPPRQTKEQKNQWSLALTLVFLDWSQKTHLDWPYSFWNEGVWKLQNMDDTWLREKIGIWRVEERNYNKYLVLYTAENMWSLPLLLFSECINSLCGQKCLLYSRNALLISLELEENPPNQKWLKRLKIGLTHKLKSNFWIKLVFFPVCSRMKI